MQGLAAVTQYNLEICSHQKLLSLPGIESSDHRAALRSCAHASHARNALASARASACCCRATTQLTHAWQNGKQSSTHMLSNTNQQSSQTMCLTKLMRILLSNANGRCLCRSTSLSAFTFI